MNELEKKFVEKILNTYKIKKEEALDIGCGPKKGEEGNVDEQAFTDRLTGVDKNKPFEPDILLDFCTQADRLQTNKYKLILFSHMLEDTENPYDALRQSRRILKDDGLLVIIQPHRNRYPRIGSYNANPGHKYDFEPYDMLYMVEITFLGKYEVIDKQDDLSDRSFGLAIKKLNMFTESNYRFPGINRHFKGKEGNK